MSRTKITQVVIRILVARQILELGAGPGDGRERWALSPYTGGIPLVLDKLEHLLRGRIGQNPQGLQSGLKGVYTYICA